MKFLCDPKNNQCVEITFGEGSVPLKGMQTKTEDVTEFLHKLARFTEHCLDKWIDHIHQQRWKYFELNYFTIDQLVILQQELLKVGSELGPDNSLYPLLSAVKENCTYKDLVDAMQNASSDMEKDEMKDDDECKEKKVHNVEVDQGKEEKVKNFIEDMTKAGFEESLAIEAVKHVDIDNIENGILWCVDHMGETNMIEGENEDERGDLRVMAYAGWKKFNQSISSLTAKVIQEQEASQRDLDVDSLINILTLLWEVFLTSVSSGVTDCLSVEHLGLILKRLAEKADVLSTVLSVYMMGTSQPLPQADEVLMCTPQTTLDQLCVFWRRTIMDTSSKIHCLVNSDLLDFEVSDKGERELEKYIHQNKQNDLQYRLVVICSAENEYKSPIIAALDKFRRPPLPIPDNHDIADYVKRKLQVKEGNTAAAVDFDNSCVRVVKSWRAGVGKSLYVRRMNAKLANKNSHHKVEDLVMIPLQDKEINVSLVIQNLLSCMLPPGDTKVRIIHLDIAHEVRGGVDFFLFNLLILGCLTHKTGHVWRRSPGDLYLVEIMPVVEKMTARMGDTTRYVHHVFDFLPYLTCRSPLESLDILTDKPKPKDFKEEDQLFDEMVFAGSLFQRPYQYLSRFNQEQELNKFDATVTCGTPADCLNILLSPHPYLFFNPDGHTITFLGFNIQRWTLDLIDQQTGKVLEKAIMSRNLYDGLHSNRVPIHEDFNSLPRFVHGGTTTTDIKRKVEEAKGIAQENAKDNARQVYTVLFFDEANTTEAIGMIKEIMCDRSIEGKPLNRCENLRFVAACNPYRKHSETLIKRLEQAGLGYHVDADKTTDRLGRVPMRRLVYRVQPLPQSLLPLVWDFGQLNTQTEELYIRQMVKRYDECSFVSLRDVERVMNVMSWFYAQSQNGRTLFEEINKKIQPYPVEKWIIEKEEDKNEENECQDVFLENVQLEKNIARNMALKENVFMMVICTELRIPLFLVGKPGSSKSLAKTIVADAMQGNAAHKEFFREFKQVQMVSFQCSPLSTPDGIVGTFRQCAQFQKDKDLKRFVSVVVLDEVGLAEDSPKMPLKTLHPLLEDGCQGDEKPEQYKKVAFIGISNWALDPAKINRGILVQREIPDIKELMNTADLMKMIYSFVEQTDIAPAWCQLQHSIKRNFGGLDTIDPIQIFSKRLTMVDKNAERRYGDPKCSTKGLILACLSDTNNTKSESRYLLLLTENYGALSILPQLIPATNITTIFGSSFPKDQEYTQICRNINLIKVCMETDRTVVLLNLENLYESLYDALNQYYVYFGGERYVDLGLGTHRVKCRVHKNFRLIVVAEKDVVYKKFPIPLINRLEKHFLTVNTILNRHQSYLADELKEWAEKFSSETDTTKNMEGHKKERSRASQSVAEVFMGYHADTCSSIILHIYKKHGEQTKTISNIKILKEAKNLLLWCATPDAVVRLDRCGLEAEERMILMTMYMKEQCHESFAQYLEFKLHKEQTQELFAQITTHSKLLSSTDKLDIQRSVEIPPGRIVLESLQSFDTEQQFSSKIRSVLQSDLEEKLLLVIQCDSGNTKANLIACARYCIEAEYQRIKDIKEMKDTRKAPCHVIFIIQLPRIAGGCFSGFQCGLWHSAHIDDLRAQDEGIPPIMEMLGKSVGSMMEKAIKTKSKADVRQIEANSVDQIDMESKSTDTEFPRQNKSEGRETHNPSGESGQDQGHEIIYERVDNKLDVDSLILSCVQSALAMAIFFSSGLPSFVQGLILHIAALLNEKEKKHSFKPDNWLSLEAAKAENINKAGTFRRSCIQHFESKIAPILAGIIAHIDTNHNMDILRDHISSGNWMARFWLQIINTHGAIQLQYHDLFLAEQKELNEVIVKTTGCEGQIFAAKMPFSWLIFEQIDSIWRLTQVGPEEMGKSEKMVDILKETKLGQLLQTLEGNVSTEEVVNIYAEDVIYMVYYAQTPIEHKIVYDCVKDMSDLLHKDTESSILARFVQVHECYNRIIQDLHYFHSINQVWPKCSETVNKMKKENSDQFMLGILGLCTMIQDLCPPDDDHRYLNDAGKQQEWLQKICNFRPVIMKGLTLYSSATESEAFTKA
ncbi:hypothetical protein ACJMK2_027956, partial [Sinanodonta woodiana]